MEPEPGGAGRSGMPEGWFMMFDPVGLSDRTADGLPLLTKYGEVVQGSQWQGQRRYDLLQSMMLHMTGAMGQVSRS